jgi:hypothetical protein
MNGESFVDMSETLFVIIISCLCAYRMEGDLTKAVSTPEFEVDKLLGCMKKFAAEFLSAGERSLKMDTALKEILNYYTLEDELLEDVHWFSSYFPGSLRMANFVAAFKFMQKINNR